MTIHIFVLVSRRMKWDFIFTLLHLLIFSSSAADILLPGQSIWDGYSLVSANGTFELGFFSPGNSSNSYLGIWYHNISEQTVVWVANRDWPLGDTSNKLTFTRDGNLMIVDGRGASFVFTFGTAATNKTTATMLDTGNLVLMDDNGQIWWQSFDNPADNFLPGMLVGMVDGQNRLLTSWRSSNDPGTGDFSFGANPNGTKQFLTWQQGRNIYSFTDEQILSTHFPLSFSFVWGEGDYYMTLPVSYRVSSLNEFIPTRMLIGHTGQLSVLSWIAPQWLLFFSEPRTTCNIFNLCGSFSVCNDRNLPPSCECLSGFQPADVTEWAKGAKGAGCVRTANLQCRVGQPDGFLLIDSVKFPINGINSSERGVDKCRLGCSNNCACIAFAFPDVCRFWYGDIATLQQRDDGGNNAVGDFYLRLAASALQDLSIPRTVVFNNKLKIIVLATVISVTISCISIGSLLCWRRHKARAKWSQDQAILLLGDDIARSLGETNKSGPEFTLFDFTCIEEATSSFSTENKLGQGGFGAVYKGILAEDQEIAVKRLSTYSGQGLEEFKNEILLIAKLQHRNLVRLLGCCIQRDEKILIYEYLPNKSLDFFLFDRENGAQLDWVRRFHIIEGIAQGLIYLHKHSRLQIIHRDLKASNVLLDADMNPKISDFGLARIFNPKETMVNTIRVAGTYGYMPPEYVTEGLFSVKSDVFSFGVLLLEIVSGKRNNSFHRHKNSFNLVGYAWELWKEGKLLDLIDPLIGDTFSVNEITRCINVGLLCVQENAADRPTMTEVITMLSTESAPSTDPKQPAFYTMRIQTKTDLPQKTSSACTLTVTSVDGR